MGKYKWQGEPVKVEFGSCMVKFDEDRPLCWWNYECTEFGVNGLFCVPAIRVTLKNGYWFLLGNHYGIGVYKLLKGGWPNCTHFSLDGKFSTTPILAWDYFDLEGYEKYEADRNQWLKENYPKEWEKKRIMLDILKGPFEIKPVK